MDRASRGLGERGEGDTADGGSGRLHRQELEVDSILVELRWTADLS